MQVQKYLPKSSSKSRILPFLAIRSAGVIICKVGKRATKGGGILASIWNLVVGRNGYEYLVSLSERRLENEEITGGFAQLDRCQVGCPERTG